jgi:hypothetical protein
MRNLWNVWGDIQIYSDIGGITGRAYFEFLIIPAPSQVRKNARNLLHFCMVEITRQFGFGNGSYSCQYLQIDSVRIVKGAVRYVCEISLNGFQMNCAFKIFTL